MSHVDRLAMVSKILLEPRFLELKAENERLRLSLFWIDHSINTLQHLMVYANNRRGGPRCYCRCCVRAKRYYPNFENDVADEPCRFGPWFEKIVQEHGLGFASSGKDTIWPCSVDRECHPMPDADVHFLLFPTLNAPATSWCSWAYGAKLWKAQTTQDPGLISLSALFKTISAESDAGRYDSDWDSDS
jgi:hypothetical protein